jgi:hypothetical protein
MTNKSGNNSNPFLRLFRLWYPKVEFTDLGRSTFRRHLAAAFFDGIFSAVVAVSGFLMRKELDASEFQVALFFCLPMVVFLFSTVGTSFTNHKNYRVLILVYGILGRLAIGAILLNHHPLFFIALMTWSNLNFAMFIPAQNIIFRSNYTRENRGVSFTKALVVTYIVSSVTTLIVGKLLNNDPGLFPYIFTAGGAAGFIAYFLYFSMPRDLEKEAAVHGHEKKPRAPFFGEFFRILRSDGLFLKYEICFFIYGVAFMMGMTMMPLYIKDVLDADWDQAAKVFGVIHPVVMVLFLPFFGRLLDRTNVIPVAALAYFLLAFWPFILAVGSSMYMAYFAMVFFGLGMSGVHVAWQLGAHTFAKEEEIQGYTAVHVSLVGMRAAFAPFLGLLIKTLFGFTVIFVLSGSMLMVAALLMFILERRRKKRLIEGSSASYESVPL